MTYQGRTREVTFLFSFGDVEGVTCTETWERVRLNMGRKKPVGISEESGDRIQGQLQISGVGGAGDGGLQGRRETETGRSRLRRTLQF